MHLRNRRTKLSAAVLPPLSLGPGQDEDVLPTDRGPSDGLSTPDAAGRVTLSTPQKTFSESNTQPDQMQPPAAQTPFTQTTAFVEDGPKAPKRHGTPRRLSPKHPALLRLRSIFDSRLSQKKYESYEAIVSTLVRRSAREPKIREHYRPALRRFLVDNRQAVKVHNKFARSYNKTFEGKHERYHLPVFDDMEIEQDGETHLGQDTGGTTTEQRQDKTEDMPNDQTNEGRRPEFDWQLDGAADMYPIPNTALHGIPAGGLQSARSEKVPHMSEDRCQHAAPGDFGIEDVAMMDVFEQPDPPFTQEAHELHCTGTGEKDPCDRAVFSTQGVDIEESEITHPDRTPIHEISAVSQDLLQPALVKSSRILEEDSSHADGNLTGDLIAPQAEATTVNKEIPESHVGSDGLKQPRVDNENTNASANITETEANPSSGSSSRGDTQQPLGAGQLLLGETASIPSIGIARHRSIRSAHSAQCYLAWLAHRRSRFPSAPPKSSECILIAKKIGRSSVEVYDAVMWHWGLETSSKWGEWHKQNRLQVLGEDPVFDEEERRHWQTWLGDGRVEMRVRLGR